MRVTDILEDSELDEAQMDDGIKKVMTSKGYKYIGHGQDQDAYFAPDGSVLKIFGYDRDKGRSGFTKAQDSLITFATYCQNNTQNQFLPEFSDWTPFVFKKRTYLQIKCERLFPLTGQWQRVGDQLDDLTSYVENRGVKTGLTAFLGHRENSDENALLTMHFGMEGLQALAKTLGEIIAIGKKKGYGIDLHSGNFMLASDSTIVINDPYFTGSFRGW